MKILIVAPHFYPKVGGVESYALAVAKGLKERRNHDIVVVTSNHEAKKRDEINIQGIKVIRLPISFKISNTPINPLWYFMLRKIIKVEKPNVINTHSPVPFMADMATLAAKSIPVVATYHAGSMLKGAGGVVDAILGFYEKHILPKVLNKSAAVGAVYPVFVEKIVKDKNKVSFTPPGIDTSLFKPNQKIKKTVDVIFVGRLEKTSSWKGVDVLLNALKIVKKTHPGVKAQIIGNGDAVETYRDLTHRLGLDDNVSFVENISGEELVKFYQGAKMLVLPSKTESESFGMVLAEAMSCGTPVIGSNIGGIPNIVKHGYNGLLSMPGDPKLLAKAISELVKDADYRRRLAARTRETIEWQFSKKTLIENTLKLIESATNPKIIHVSAYYPPHLGGMETSVYEIAQQSANDGYVVNVITSNLGSFRKHRDEIVKNYKVKRLRSLELFHTPIIWGLFFKILTMKKGTIIHMHIAQAFMPEITYLAARLKGLKVIAHVHADVEASGKAGFLLPLYKKYILSHVLRGADVVILPTESYGKYFNTKYKLKREPLVVPTGISEIFYNNNQPRKIDKKVLKLLYVGRLSIEKNIPMIIKACEKSGKSISLDIIGSGPESLCAEITELANNASESEKLDIHLLGRKPRSDLPKIYRKADALIVASDYESQSLVAIEAMASGTPVIGFDIPGLRDSVKNAGLLVDKDVHSLADAIHRFAVDTTLRKELSTNAVKQAQEFRWENILSILYGVYEDLC